MICAFHFKLLNQHVGAIEAVVLASPLYGSDF